MLKSKPIIKCIFVFLLVGVLQSTAWSQIIAGPFEISGFYQFTTAASLEYANPNNAGGWLKEEGRPNLLLMRQQFTLRINGKLSDEWRVFFEPRVFHDLTKAADAHFRSYESFPVNFSGNGNMLRVGGNDCKAELWQAYADYNKGDLWIRLGKQQIAWGEAIALRVLDTVNPLDLSSFFFFDRSFEEFDAIRIPQWFIRTDYRIPFASVPDFTLEFILNPGAVVPTLFADQGAPFNVVPGYLEVLDNVKQGHPTVGGRVTGTYKSLQFSLNFVTKPNDEPTGRLVGLRPDERGIPVLAPFGDPTLYRILLQGEHPRIYVVGGSMNYSWRQAGAMLRAETTLTIDNPFQFTVANPTVKERKVWKTVLAVDRPVKLVEGWDSLSIGFQFFETVTYGDIDNIFYNGAKVDRGVTNMTLFLQQPFYNQRLILECLGIYDTDGCGWIQSGGHWTLGDNLRFDLYYNKFTGTEKRAGRWGSFNWASGPFFRFTYGF